MRVVVGGGGPTDFPRMCGLRTAHSAKWGGNVADFLPMSAQYANFSFVVLTFGLTLAIYFAFRYQINFWWLNFWYSLPSFGKLARLSKDATRSSNPGWLCGEETLCGDYRTHITTTSEAEFYKRLIYIRKAQDRGRKPLPGWMIVFLAILLLAEGQDDDHPSR